MRTAFRLLISISISFAIVFANLARFSASDAQTDKVQQVEILIINGKLVDGSGRGAREADVGIRGDRIVFVGDANKAHLKAARTIEASGMIVAPGFIDGHTHTLGDLTNDQTKSNQAYLLQGVTT